MRQAAMIDTPRLSQAKRRNCPVALAIFLIAWVAVLAITFAPEGRFVTSPGIIHDQR